MLLVLMITWKWILPSDCLARVWMSWKISTQGALFKQEPTNRLERISALNLAYNWKLLSRFTLYLRSENVVPLWLCNVTFPVDSSQYFMLFFIGHLLSGAKEIGAGSHNGIMYWWYDFIIEFSTFPVGTVWINNMFNDSGTVTTINESEFLMH